MESLKLIRVDVDLLLLLREEGFKWKIPRFSEDWSMKLPPPLLFLTVNFRLNDIFLSFETALTLLRKSSVALSRQSMLSFSPLLSKGPDSIFSRILSIISR